MQLFFSRWQQKVDSVRWKCDAPDFCAGITFQAVPTASNSSNSRNNNNNNNQLPQRAKKTRPRSRDKSQSPSQSQFFVPALSPFPWCLRTRVPIAIQCEMANLNLLLATPSSSRSISRAARTMRICLLSPRR